MRVGQIAWASGQAKVAMDDGLANNDRVHLGVGLLVVDMGQVCHA